MNNIHSERNSNKRGETTSRKKQNTRRRTRWFKKHTIKWNEWRTPEGRSIEEKIEKI
jgi:hypothetical protein